MEKSHNKSRTTRRRHRRNTQASAESLVPSISVNDNPSAINNDQLSASATATRSASAASTRSASATATRSASATATRSASAAATRSDSATATRSDSAAAPAGSMHSPLIPSLVQDRRFEHLYTIGPDTYNFISGTKYLDDKNRLRELVIILYKLKHRELPFTEEIKHRIEYLATNINKQIKYFDATCMLDRESDEYGVLYLLFKFINVGDNLNLFYKVLNQNDTKEMIKKFGEDVLMTANYMIPESHRHKEYILDIILNHTKFSNNTNKRNEQYEHIFGVAMNRDSGDTLLKLMVYNGHTIPRHLIQRIIPNANPSALNYKQNLLYNMNKINNVNKILYPLSRVNQRAIDTTTVDMLADYVGNK